MLDWVGGSITFGFLAFHSAFPKMEIAMLVQHVDLLSIVDVVDAVDLSALRSPLFLVARRGCSVLSSDCPCEVTAC